MLIMAYDIKKSFSILILLLASTLLITPFLFNHAMIIGSDAIFHFNRFYDTAMQIKHCDFQYFISIYGFQSSGRIVNALYGPLMAYAQGLLVLLSPSWFVYQMLSNAILYFCAGLSLYLLLKKARIGDQYSLPLSIFYMTCYSIQYWTIRQGFSSWGAALMPVCFIPLIDLVENKKLSTIKTAVAVAAMAQVHMLSAFLLVFVYICFFSSIFFNQSRMIKLKLIKQVGMSVLVCTALVANLIYCFIAVDGYNDIAQPFTNKYMWRMTVFTGSSYWLVYPPVLILAIVFFVWQMTKMWHKSALLLRVTEITAFICFTLSTNIFPWRLFSNSVFSFIQFPFRFFIPFTVLLLLAVGLMLQNNAHISWSFYSVIIIVMVASLCQTMMSSNNTLNVWHRSTKYLNGQVHTRINSDDNSQVKQSFFKKDKSKALQYIVKSTPDYLPIDSNNKKSKYELYQSLILNNQQNFRKSVKDHKLFLNWYGDYQKKVQLPIIKYKNTVMILNHTSISKHMTQFSAINTPIITQKKGPNQLVVYYQHDWFLYPILLFTFMSWSVVFIVYQKTWHSN